MTKKIARYRSVLAPFLCIGIALVWFATASATNPSQNITVIKFSGLIDGTGARLPATDIAVSNGLILQVGDNLESAYPGAKVVDKTDLFGLPGLIDAHVHITYALSGPHDGKAWQALGSTPEPDLLTGSITNACKTLKTGVTSVRDLFSGGMVSHHLRALIEKGHVQGPRLFVSGVGMHPSTVEGYSSSDPKVRLEGIRKLVLERVEDGSDWLKIFATTGSADDLTGTATFTNDELIAAIKLAHENGLKVAVHSYSDAAVAAALAAGAESLDHPVGVDQVTLAHWAQSSTYYVPTVDHNRYYADYRAEYGYDADIEANLRGFVQDNLATLKAAHDAGVKVAFGSDAVMSMFGENTRELEWFIEAGLTPAQTIKAATFNGADLLGQRDRLGRLQVGYVADIIGVSGNPLADIKALTRGVSFVMARGEQVDLSCREQ